MARIGIVFGLVLFGMTIAALSATTQKSYTQFVPMMFGIPLLFFGVVALNPHRRGKAVVAALMLAAVGLLFGVVRIIVLGMAWVAGDNFNLLSFELVAAMSAVCLVFVVIAERWRRRRTAEEGRVEAARRQTGTLLKSPMVIQPSAAAPLAQARGDSENPYQTPAILIETTPPPPTNDTAK